MEKKDFLKLETTVLAKMKDLDHEFSRIGLINTVIYRGDNPKCIKDNFYFGVKIVDDSGKLIHIIDFLHRKDEKNVIIKLSYHLGRIVDDYRVIENLTDEEIRKRKVWYCPINDAEKIKSIREVLDHIARQFNGSFKN